MHRAENRTRQWQERRTIIRSFSVPAAARFADHSSMLRAASAEISTVISAVISARSCERSSLARDTQSIGFILTPCTPRPRWPKT